MRCDRCGEENPDRARFCSSCGAQLVSEPRQERKVVSVLFVDLVGFTGRSDRRDPEDVRDVLQSYRHAAEAAISSFGGNMEKFIGDAVMAVFGAPISHGDDAERAVRAGLKVLESVKQLGLDARAAVNTGEAVVAVGAAATSGQALAMGDVVNTASRLQSAAPPGGLIVGEETYSLTKEAIQYREHTAVDAKGKDEPVEAWLAIAPVTARAEKPRTPLVGRDREMQLLDSIWDRAITDRRPHLATVLGPPGIGKSRLQREFSEQVRQSDGAVAKGRCLPYGERTAYGAFIQMMRDTCGIYENDSVDAARTKLGATVTKLLPPSETEETTYNLTVLLGLGAGEQSLQRGYLFFAARRFIEALALSKPLLLVLEDLHWADTGLLDLVDYLAAYVKDSPLMILCLARPEFFDLRPAWGSGLHAHTTIALEPLSNEDASKLARTLLTQVAGATDTAAHLAQAGEGNPLFIEELASSLGDKAQAEFRLPTTIRAAIASRLDALPHSARDVLLDASVIGRTFWRGVLQRMGDHADLDNDLALLESRDFIRRVATTQVRGDIEYLFKHILIHDVAYATLPRSIRRQRHREVAEYIEGAVQDTAGLSAILAHHWREAGEPSKAVEYLMRAAEQALNAWALTEAVALYDSAVALATDDQERFRIMLARGLARSRLGEYPDAVADLGKLLPHLSGHDRIEALLGYGWAQVWTESTAETIAAAEEALRLAEGAHDGELVPVAKALLSTGLGMRAGPGDLDGAVEIGEEALRLWPPGARPWWHINHEHMLGEQYYWTGRLADVHALMTSASRSGSDPQSIQAQLRSAALRAQILCSLGQYEESIRLFDETTRLAVEAGRPIRVVRNYSTQPLRELFELAEARRRSEESLEGPDEAGGFMMPRANARADVMQAALLAGDLETAETFWHLQWDESTTTARSWTHWLLPCRLAAARADMELVSNHVDEAIEWGRKAIELSKPVRRLKYEIVGRASLGRALVAAGKPHEALTELTLAAAQAEVLGSPRIRWEVLAALGRAHYIAGDDKAAESALASASTLIRDIAAGLDPHRAERFLGAQPVRDVLKGQTKAQL